MYLMASAVANLLTALDTGKKYHIEMFAMLFQGKDMFKAMKHII